MGKRHNRMGSWMVPAEPKLPFKVKCPLQATFLTWEKRINVSPKEPPVAAF